MNPKRPRRFAKRFSRSFRRRICRIVFTAVALISSLHVQADSAKETIPAAPVLDWTNLMIDAIRVDNSGPALSSRNLAILHLAMFDAVNAAAPAYQAYSFLENAPAGILPDVAAVAAAHKITTFLYPGVAVRADRMLADLKLAQASNPSLYGSLAFGLKVAETMLTRRQADGSSTDVPYIPSAAPGQWRRTPPYFRPPVSPQWRHVHSFALPDLDGFLPAPPPALSSPEYARAFNEVKSLGDKNSSARTPEQTQIAHFWSDFSYTSMPPGHWHLIATDLARSRHHSLLDTARLFALLSMSQADAAVVCWEAKYRHNFWRPVTAIRRANEDDNDTTAQDANWDSLLAAPPFPSFTSGHSTFSAASAAVVRQFYGTDKIAFTTTADGLPGVSRSFTNLTQCVDEIGISRVYGGIHYSFDNEEGKKCGKKVGEFISANYLLPLSELPRVRVDEDSGALRVHAALGSQVITEVSVDQIAWQPISTNIAQTGGIRITNTTIPTAKFFRARPM